MLQAILFLIFYLSHHHRTVHDPHPIPNQHSKTGIEDAGRQRRGVDCKADIHVCVEICLTEKSLRFLWTRHEINKADSIVAVPSYTAVVS